MRIQVRSLDTEPAVFTDKVLAKQLELPEDLFQPGMPLQISVKAIKAGDEVVLNVTVAARYALICSRCLEPFEQDQTDTFDLYFDIDRHTDFIDCHDDIRQELIIARSLNPVCRTDCKGLCKDCGVNLNLETCTCKKVKEPEGGEPESPMVNNKKN